MLVAIAATATFVIPIARDSLPDLSQQDQYQLTQDDIHLHPVPTRWVPPDLVNQVLTQANLQGRLNSLDTGLSKTLAEAFRLHPWVAEVQQVRKSLAGGIDVSLKYREPVAMVHVSVGMYPIDSTGVLLPPADFSVSDTDRFLKVENIRSTPGGPAGTSWGDSSVTGAAQLAAGLADVWEKLQLEAILAPTHIPGDTQPDDLLFSLRTRGGSHIVWGRIPDSKYPGELTTDQKVARLEKYLADFGSYAEPSGPYEIDIRHWQEISRRPLDAALRTTSRVYRRGIGGRTASPGMAPSCVRSTPALLPSSAPSTAGLSSAS